MLKKLQIKQDNNVCRYFGRSANINETKKKSKKYDLKIISDTAQAIGSKYYGKYSGTLILILWDIA